jgi:hypothetical protein
VTSEWLIGKDVEGSGSGIIYHPGNCLEWLRTTTRNVSQDSWSLDRDLYRDFPYTKQEHLPRRLVNVEMVIKICFLNCCNFGLYGFETESPSLDIILSELNPILIINLNCTNIHMHVNLSCTPGSLPYSGQNVVCSTLLLIYHEVF